MILDYYQKMDTLDNREVWLSLAVNELKYAEERHDEEGIKEAREKVIKMAKSWEIIYNRDILAKEEAHF